MTKSNKMLFGLIAVISAVCILLTGMAGIYPVFAADFDYSIAEQSNCVINENADNSLRVQPTGAATFKFDPAFSFANNAEGRTFPGTERVIPDPMIMFSIKEAGDLRGYMALKWEGHENYGWLMVRDLGSTDGGVTTKLRISFYTGRIEHNTKDYVYTYGMKIFAYVVYGKNVNRWRVAIEGIGGIYEHTDTDWHAMAITESTGVADTAPRRLIVSFQTACNGLDMKIATSEDVEDVDITDVKSTEVTSVKNEDDSFILTSNKQGAYVDFNRPMLFGNVSNGFWIKGSEQVAPETAMVLSIAEKGDLNGKIGLGAIGSSPSMQLIIKDKQTGDESTKLSASYYDDTDEQGEFEFDYTYGKKIYIWMTYGADVNRWSFAVEQADGTHKIYLTELFAYTIGAIDYKTAKLFRLSFSDAGDKVTAVTRDEAGIPTVKPKEKFNVMNSEEVDGAVSLSHEGESVYTFADYIHFKSTNLTYTALSDAIAENNLCLTLQPDSIPTGKMLGIRLLAEEDVESSKIAETTLRLEIVSDNGDGTGKIGFSCYRNSSYPKMDYTTLDYKWGDPIYIYHNYRTDVNRWTVAIPNTNGVSFTIVSKGWWQCNDVGVNSGSAKVPHQVSLIAYDGVKNMTAAIVKAEDVLQNEEPPVPTDTPFVGSGLTSSMDENGYHQIEMNSGSYAKSTWTADISKGLIFRISDFGGSWVSLNVAGSYYHMPNGTLGTSNNGQLTLLFRDHSGSLQVSLYNGNEILRTTYSGIPSKGTHILTMKRFLSGSQYFYRIYIDNVGVAMGYSLREDYFNNVNNFNEETETYDGAYFKFAAYKNGVKIDSIRAYQPGEEEEKNDWVTNSNANVEKISDNIYNLDMESYSSLRLTKMANLTKGVTFKVAESEERSQFGLAFAMLKEGASLDIPPSIGASDIYYNFMDNGDGTVNISSSDGQSATVTLDISEEHNYSLVEITTESGVSEYVLAIDGEPVFTRGMLFEKYIMLNNGSMGAFPTVFTKSNIKISGFTGEFTVPKVSEGDENLWDEDWSDDSWNDDSWSDDSWSDDSWSDDSWSDDSWSDDSWSDDSWSDDSWSDDSWSEDFSDDSWDDITNEITDIEDTTVQSTRYKKVLKRVKIERDPIIVEYSLWWLWLIISVVVVAGGTVAFIIIRKKRKASK